MTVIAISGTHGVGKTTLLNSLAHAGLPVLKYSVSRAVQQVMGHATLADALSTTERMMAFQTRLATTKYEVDTAMVRSRHTFVVDRSLADVAAYARAWAMREGSQEVVDWAKHFWRECHELQSHTYAGTIVLSPHPDIPFEPEDRRGDEDSRNTIASYITEFMNDHNFALLPRTHCITSVSLPDRVEETIRAIHNFPSC